MPFPEVGDTFNSLDDFKRVVYRFAASREIRLGPRGMKDGRTYWRCLLDDKTRTGRAKKGCTYTIATSWADARRKSVKIHRIELSHSCDPVRRKEQAAAAEEAMLDRFDKLEKPESESDDDSSPSQADSQTVAGSRIGLRRRTFRADHRNVPGGGNKGARAASALAARHAPRLDRAPAAEQEQSALRDERLHPRDQTPLAPVRKRARYLSSSSSPFYSVSSGPSTSAGPSTTEASPTAALSSVKATDPPPGHQTDKFEPGDVLTTSEVPADSPLSALKARLAASAASPSSAPNPLLPSFRAFFRAISPSLSTLELEIYVEAMHSLGMQSEDDLAQLVRCERSVLAKLARSTKPAEEGRLDPSGGIPKLLMAMKSAYEAEH